MYCSDITNLKFALSACGYVSNNSQSSAANSLSKSINNSNKSDDVDKSQVSSNNGKHLDSATRTLIKRFKKK